jgi:Glycine-rich domain
MIWLAWQIVLSLALAWCSLPYISGFVLMIDPYRFAPVTSFVNSASNTGTSNTVNLPSGTLPGDLAIVFAIGSTTAITVPAGWVNVHTDNIAGAQTALGYRYLQSGDTTTGTWSNAQRVGVTVYRFSGFRASTTVSGASSGTSTVAGISSGTTAVGFDWVNAGTTTKSQTVTSYTTRSGSNAGGDWWTGDGATPTSNQTGQSGLWRSYTVSIVSSYGANPLSGGIQYEDENFYYCAFTTSGSNTLTVATPCSVDFLLVGAGGGGGTQAGGGGGAGEAKEVDGVSVSTTQSITVGAFGAGGAASASPNSGSDGGDTTVGANTAHGGGYGGGAGTAGHSVTGSGGGGGGRPNISGGTSSGVGHAGGHSYTPNTAGTGRGGGGGGYTTAGTDGDSTPNGGTGTTTWATWMHPTYGVSTGGVCGGGGGGNRATPTPNGAGGGSGAGAGSGTSGAAGGDATANSGSGGGGAGWNGAGTAPRGGNGADGMVIARTVK